MSLGVLLLIVAAVCFIAEALSLGRFKWWAFGVAGYLLSLAAG